MSIEANAPEVTDDDRTPTGRAVVEAVSTSSETPVLDLPPLYEAVDPDALDDLFEGRRTIGAVTFEYAGHDVTVRADGEVDVFPIE